MGVVVAALTDGQLRGHVRWLAAVYEDVSLLAFWSSAGREA